MLRSGKLFNIPSPPPAVLCCSDSAPPVWLWLCSWHVALGLFMGFPATLSPLSLCFPPPAGTAPAPCPTPVGPLTLTHGGLASEAGQCARSVALARVLLKTGCYSIPRVAGKPAPVGLRFISLSRLLVLLGCHFINGNWHHVEA